MRRTSILVGLIFALTTCVESEPVLISGATTATFTPFARRYVTRLRVVLETPLTGPKDSVARRSFLPFRVEGKGRGVEEFSPGETSILRYSALLSTQTDTVNRSIEDAGNAPH